MTYPALDMCSSLKNFQSCVVFPACTAGALKSYYELFSLKQEFLSIIIILNRLSAIYIEI